MRRIPAKFAEYKPDTVCPIFTGEDDDEDDPYAGKVRDYIRAMQIEFTDGTKLPFCVTPEYRPDGPPSGWYTATHQKSGFRISAKGEPRDIVRKIFGFWAELDDADRFKWQNESDPQKLRNAANRAAILKVRA